MTAGMTGMEKENSEKMTCLKHILKIINVSHSLMICKKYFVRLNGIC